ncbi:MAG: hypothetical protein DRJ49_02080 [Thermoprotei archaeon]|nr:MAG: hypothetical protein DRJ49_02080 [Thermoprotei archaeon]
MRKRRRSKIRIVVDIMRVLQMSSGAKITQIMCEANMPYDRLLRYLEELKSKGFITEKRSNDHTLYYLTRKGFDFLVEFKKIERFAKAFGIEL